MFPQPLRLLEPVLEPAIAELIRLALLSVSAVCVAWIALAVATAGLKIFMALRPPARRHPLSDVEER